eukprot:1007221-Rhodomonas_salina.2
MIHVTSTRWGASSGPSVTIPLSAVTCSPHIPPSVTMLDGKRLQAGGPQQDSEYEGEKRGCLTMMVSFSAVAFVSTMSERYPTPILPPMRPAPWIVIGKTGGYETEALPHEICSAWPFIVTPTLNQAPSTNAPSMSGYLRLNHASTVTCSGAVAGGVVDGIWTHARGPMWVLKASAPTTPGAPQS